MKRKSNKSHKSISRSLQTVISILNFDLKKEIAERLKNDNKITIVDIGCGVGRSLWELSNLFSRNDILLKLFGNFYSENPNPNSIFFENQKRYFEVIKNPLLIAEEFNIESTNKVVPKLYNANACKRLPIRSNSVDIIYSTNAFYFFDEKIEAIKEISRILAINGIAILNIDRTENDFWPSNLYFPRIQIYKENKIINAKKLLQSKSGNKFTISIKKADSYGTGKNSYILMMRKLKKRHFNFSRIKF